MPRFALQIKADLTNVQEIQWDRSHQWCIDWQQAGSSERRDGVYISADEEHELSGSRGTANLAIKFDKHDKHEASARLEQAPESRACKVRGPGYKLRLGPSAVGVALRTVGSCLLRPDPRLCTEAKTRASGCPSLWWSAGAWSRSSGRQAGGSRSCQQARKDLVQA